MIILVRCLTQTVENPELLFVPNAEGILLVSSSICYCNEPSLVVDSAEKEFCHAEIPYRVATKPGIRTIKHAYFDQHAIGIRFGQHEKLITLLNRILSGYPFDKEILNEMLQNADDNGGTEIHFILATRHL